MSKLTGYARFKPMQEKLLKLEEINKELLEALEDVCATRSMMLKQSPSENELKEILATFERAKAAIKKATS